MHLWIHKRTWDGKFAEIHLIFRPLNAVVKHLMTSGSNLPLSRLPTTTNGSLALYGPPSMTLDLPFVPAVVRQRILIIYASSDAGCGKTATMSADINKLSTLRAVIS
ncbi:hypothetical protein L596_005161 [Steinernema carpocapsae]|uniref:Uncharacterized protein n=1 Tax=Steinernema carpocapsae TaxID=34508 RepID=A0A4U8UYC6_STECR|nr:hypothetical protein L596_005161 [Steinernema carpocapsae]